MAKLFVDAAILDHSYMREPNYLVVQPNGGSLVPKAVRAGKAAIPIARPTTAPGTAKPSHAAL